MINYDCDPRLKKILEQLNTEAEMEEEMAKASIDMKVHEILEGKSQSEIDMYFLGWDNALKHDEELHQSIHEKYEALYRNHPEFFISETATKRERQEYWRLHNI